jgi:hypothetical protein
MAIILTRHAEIQARRRHPDLGISEILALAEMSLNCGMKGPGTNGCLRTKFLGKEFVFDLAGEDFKVVTVI